METVFERVGALDVHKAQVTACVRVPEAPVGGWRIWGSFRRRCEGLMALRDWLAAHGSRTSRWRRPACTGSRSGTSSKTSSS